MPKTNLDLKSPAIRAGLCRQLWRLLTGYRRAKHYPYSTQGCWLEHSVWRSNIVVARHTAEEIQDTLDREKFDA